METPRMLTRMKYPQHYPWFMLAFLFFVVIFQVPNLLEEHFREKSWKERWPSLATMFLPLIGFMYYILKLGGKMPF